MAKSDKKSSEIVDIEGLRQSEKNPRKHNPRNIAMIEKSLSEIGAARSIVIDEHGLILAGNGTIDAAALAGISRVQVVDADGKTIIAVRRSGLSQKQKNRLAVLDKRASELSEGDIYMFNDDIGADDLSDIFSQDEQEKIGIYKLPEKSAEKEDLKSFKMVHILFSFPPEKMIDIQAALENIRKVEGVEIVQSAN